MKTTHDLALRHNDTSPLENMHAAVLYEVLKDDKVNIFKPIGGDKWVNLRKTIIAAILSTDMAHHFEVREGYVYGVYARLIVVVVAWHFVVYRNPLYVS